MSTQDPQLESEKPDDSADESGLTFVELTGKDRSRWKTYRHRFFERLAKATSEAIRRLKKVKGPRGKSLADEAQLFFGLGLSSLQAFLERPGLSNMKKRIEIARELKALRESSSTPELAQKDALGEARNRKLAYDKTLELFIAGKIHLVED